MVLKGQGRRLAALKLELDKVPVIRATTSVRRRFNPDPDQPAVRSFPNAAGSVWTLVATFRADWAPKPRESGELAGPLRWFAAIGDRPGSSGAAATRSLEAEHLSL